MHFYTFCFHLQDLKFLTLEYQINKSFSSPPTKTCEPTTTIRLADVESLLLLCHMHRGRDYQRQHGIYEHS